MRIALAFCLAVLACIGIHLAAERLAAVSYAQGYNDAIDSIQAVSVESFVDHSELVSTDTSIVNVDVAIETLNLIR